MTTVENILQKTLTGKRIQLYRTKIKFEGDRKRRIPVSYRTEYFIEIPKIVGTIVEASPVKCDILNVRVVGENGYDSQELLVITVRPLRTKTLAEITITSMTEKFEILK